MSLYFPKTLIFGGAINQVSGGGITTASLFQGWPADKLAVVYNSAYRNEPGRALEFRLRMEFVLPGMNRGVEWKTANEIPSTFKEEPRKALFAANRTPVLRGALRVSLELLGISPIVRKFPLTADLIKFVVDFNPDVIYTQLGDIPTADLFMRLADHFPLPYVVHIMDDYPSTLHRKGFFSKPVRRIMHNQLNTIFAKATTCMGISQTMCEEYSIRYGRSFTPFHNAVDIPIWALNNQKSNKECASFKLAYSGRIGKSCLTSIAEICRVIDGWSDSRVSPAFEIYVNDIAQAFTSAPFLRTVGPRIHVKEAPKRIEEVACLLGNADILVLPVDFDEDSVRFIRLSMPTKVPAYMATGVPILVYGPPDVASVRYAKSQGWAHVVQHRSPAALTEGITSICLNKELRKSVSQQAMHLVSNYHEANTVRARFRETMVKAAKRTFDS